MRGRIEGVLPFLMHAAVIGFVWVVTLFRQACGAGGDTTLQQVAIIFIRRGDL